MCCSHVLTRQNKFAHKFRLPMHARSSLRSHPQYDSYPHCVSHPLTCRPPQVCSICFKRIGLSVFVAHPDHSLSHYQCHKKAHPNAPTLGAPALPPLPSLFPAPAPHALALPPSLLPARPPQPVDREDVGSAVGSDNVMGSVVLNPVAYGGRGLGGAGGGGAVWGGSTPAPAAASHTPMMPTQGPVDLLPAL